ncbi:MAG: Fe-S protein assembly co-chaperone HscB [Pseudomonadales bacterium]
MDISTNYFDLFGLPVAYQVDSQALMVAYRNLQRHIHPDRYASQSERDQRIAMQYASYTNQALEALRSPVGRAKYLLELAGETSKEDNLGSDPVFLMEQMELREELSSLGGERQSVAVLEHFIHARRQDLQALEQHFGLLYEAKDFDTARKIISKMQFILKLISQAEDMEDDVLI